MLLDGWSKVEDRHLSGHLTILSEVAENHAEFEPAVRLLRHALMNASQWGDTFCVGTTLANLGRVRGRLGDRAAAARLLDAGLRSKRKYRNQAGAAETLNDIAVLARSEQRWADALRTHREALAEERAIGDPHMVVKILVELGRTLSASGDPEQARDVFTEARDLGRRYGLRHLLAHAHAGLADLGGPDAGRDRQVALALYREIGVPPAQPPGY